MKLLVQASNIEFMERIDTNVGGFITVAIRGYPVIPYRPQNVASWGLSLVQEIWQFKRLQIEAPHSASRGC